MLHHMTVPVYVAVIILILIMHPIRFEQLVIEDGVLTHLIILILFLLAESSLEIHVTLPVMRVIVIVLKLLLLLFMAVILPVLIPKLLVLIIFLTVEMLMLLAVLIGAILVVKVVVHHYAAKYIQNFKY
jgi:hypothetical protein